MKRYLIVVFFCVCSFARADGPYSVEQAIFRVEVPKGDVLSFGTGVLVAPGKILTNCHIVNGGWPRVVHRKTGDLFTVSKYYRLGNLDACILVGGFPGSPVSLSATAVPGENVWIFGYPAGLPVVGQGSVKGLVEDGNTLLLGAFCAKGSSGGPVVNVKGELIGLNYAVYQYQNQCLSIPASLLRSYM